jgi:hypothetical protein
MILLPPELRAALRANAAARHAAERDERPEPNPLPLLKLFNPLGAATWIATELYADGDTLFGLADLGFGCPELGTFSLSEIASVRLPFGLGPSSRLGTGIERDVGFTTDQPLSVWVAMARRTGSLLQAEFEFRRAAAIELPHPKGNGDG